MQIMIKEYGTIFALGRMRGDGGFEMSGDEIDLVGGHEGGLFLVIF